MPASTNLGPSLTRWYVETRPKVAESNPRPLATTLPPDDQEKIGKFYHEADRELAYASCLLKHLFVHRTCHAPWDEITISRTPLPNNRPCYVHPSITSEFPNGPTLSDIDFNVSHQASLAALVGCTIGPATRTCSSDFGPSSPTSGPAPIQVGVDITCTKEHSGGLRRREPITTQKAFDDFVDIYAEILSKREVAIIKNSALDTSQQSNGAFNNTTPVKRFAASRRLFYTYWALKEAYLKMVGKGLLVDWAQSLEFTDVTAPEPVPFSVSRGMLMRPQWGPPETGIQISLDGKKVDDVRVQVQAWGEYHIVATIVRSMPNGEWEEFKELDIERDIGPCARGTCNCIPSAAE